MMPSHWFFINRKEPSSDEELKPVTRRRALTAPSGKQGSEEESEEDGSVYRKKSLSKIISKHFSATRDVRAFNINMPQSQ